MAVAVGRGRGVQQLLLGRVEHEGLLPLGRLALARRRALLEQHRRRRVAQVVRVGELLQRHVAHQVAAHHEHVAAHLGLGGEQRGRRARFVGHDHEVHQDRAGVPLVQELLELRRLRLHRHDDGRAEAAPLEVAERQRDERPVRHGEQRLWRVLGERLQPVAVAAGEHHRRDVHARKTESAESVSARRKMAATPVTTSVCQMARVRSLV